MTMLGRGLQWCYSYVFPIFCIGCNRVEGVWMCAACTLLMGATGVFCCPVCYKATVSGFCCFLCRSNSSLSAHVALASYEKPIVRTMVAGLKFQFQEGIVAVLSKLIADFWVAVPKVYRDIDMIVFVPLHRKRYAARGFNQAEHIATCVSRVAAVPVCSVLMRTVMTKQQALLSKVEREENVRGAFGIRSGATSVAGMRVLLVDDVYTTGSTMQACANVLIGAGAKSVVGFSVGRG